MNRMRNAYERLPDEAKDAVMEQVLQMLLWRGRDAGNGILGKGAHAAMAASEIGEIFYRNGMEFEEYT